MIYADNAATTKLDIDAYEAMKPYLLENYGNASQVYSFSRPAKKALKEAREMIAECINASPEEIFFTSGGTESDNWAIKGMLEYGDNRTTITSNIEHHAVLHTCNTIERLGYAVKYIPVNSDGVVQPETLSSCITNDTKLVSIMMVNNEIGTIQPIKQLCKIAHKHHAIFHTDAVQAAAHMPIDVQDLGVDMLSASGHKFHAPKGIGFLYKKRGIPLHSYADGGAQEFGLRAGTENIASIVAMAVAFQKYCKQIEKNTKKLQKMEKIFLNTLSGIDFIRNGGKEIVAGNINLSIKNAEGEMLLHRLDMQGICISTGSACNSENTQISHVIRAIGVPEDYAKGTIRISFGAYNTEQEAEIVAKAIIKIVKGD